jgi:hypothetical protein
MKSLPVFTTVLLLTLTAFITLSLTNTKPRAVLTATTAEPRIQAAILLDVSNSMDGLIEQAKAQLWNMVSVMGKAKCENGIPKIEIALYEYGRPADDVKTGYIKQISAFTSDLDHLSQELFKLTTNGGDEYCGHVIYTSLNELSWDTVSSNYKVIFIAGNEDFLQGDIIYTQSCMEAKKKGVIVNTIYCGPKEMGIREHWNLGSECGNGSFTNIDQNARVEDIPTPYDSTLVVLNEKLNGTYLYYGAAGASGYARQSQVDQLNFYSNKSAGLKRVTAKSNPVAYSNAQWDLVDAVKADSTGRVIVKVDKKTLPDSLKNKSKEELQQIVNAKAEERAVIQKEIQTISTQRNNYIAAEKVKAAGNKNNATLETEVEKIIKAQAKRFNMIIE